MKSKCELSHNYFNKKLEERFYIVCTIIKEKVIIQIIERPMALTVQKTFENMEQPLFMGHLLFSYLRCKEFIEVGKER